MAFEWEDLFDYYGIANPLAGYGISRIKGKRAGDQFQDELEGAPGQIQGVSDKNQAMRRAQLEASMGFFGPVDKQLERMYGPGAGGPPIDFDALFATEPKSPLENPAELEGRLGSITDRMFGHKPLENPDGLGDRLRNFGDRMRGKDVPGGSTKPDKKKPAGWTKLFSWWPG